MVNYIHDERGNKMNDTQGLYRLIYRFYRTQIEGGQYQSGEPLPAALEISEIFDVSFSTARKALQALKNDGYIELSPGRTGTVCWNRKCGLNRSELYDRINAVADMYAAMNYFLPPSLSLGARYLDQEGQAKLALIIDEIENNNSGAIFEFTAFFIRLLGNPVLLHLICELDNFVYAAFSGGDVHLLIKNNKHPWTERIPAKLFYDIVNAAGAADYARTDALFHQLIDSCNKDMNIYLGSVGLENATGKIPFRWQVYMEQERHLYSAAVDLLYRINTGEFSGRWLPPIPELAASMGLSEITVRRTIKLLNSIGVTETVKRKGTRIYGSERARRAVKIDVGLFKSRFVSGLSLLHILAITIEDVSYEAFPSFTEDCVKELTDAIENDARRGMEFFTLGAAIAIICKSSKNSVIKEIYSQIKGRLVWLYPLRLIEIQGIVLDVFPRLSSDMAVSLREGRRRDFSRQLSELMTNVFFVAQSALLQLGIKEAAKLRLPSND